MYDQIAKYLTPKTLCSSSCPADCDAVVLGSLIKGSVAIGIWPRPEDPYEGMTLKNLVSQIRQLQIFDECNPPARRYNYSGISHGVKDAIVASIKSLEGQFCGINLAFFLSELPETPESENMKKSKKGKGRELFI